MTVDRSSFVDDSGETRFAGTIQPGVGTTAGDVLTSQGDGLAAKWAAGGGGIASVEVPFAFNTPNLLTGVALLTPAVGDVYVINVQHFTVWNGTSPIAFVNTADDALSVVMCSDSLDSAAASPNWRYTSLGNIVALTTDPIILRVATADGDDPGSTTGTGSVVLTKLYP